MGQSPCSGSAFAFRNKAGTRIKMLIWDGNGVWLYAKAMGCAECVLR
ncbi:IS66 family insertion sequence element accessory protein TnpB [Aeromonas hydrophila]